jgi:hypothetical protein
MRNAKANGSTSPAVCTRTGKHFCALQGKRWVEQGCAKPAAPAQLWIGNNDTTATPAAVAKSRQHVELSALKPGTSAPSSPASNQSQPQADLTPLGRDTKFSTTPTTTGPTAGHVYVTEQVGTDGEQTYSERYEQLAFLRPHTSLKRLKYCHVFVDTERAETADVVINRRGHARWLNLRRCGLRWSCPVCAPFKAEEERRRLICALVRAMAVKKPLHHPAVVELIGENGTWHPPLARPVFDPDANGDDLSFDPEDFELLGERKPQAKYAIGFITGTVPHKYGDRLKASSDLVVKAWGYTTGAGSARRTWKQDFGVEAFVRCFDLTVGLANGWHPHIHAAVIINADKVRQYGEKFYARAFRDWFAGRWDLSLGRQLGRPDCYCKYCHWQGRLPRDNACPNKDAAGKKCGCNVRRVRNIHPTRGVQFEWVQSPGAVAEYLAKLALWPARELTSGHRKIAGRSKGQLQSKLEFVGGAQSRQTRYSLHRSPFELLRDLTETHKRLEFDEYETPIERQDDAIAFEEDLSLWHEYEQGMQGRSALRTSKGFWSHPDWGVDGMTREEQIEYLAEHVDPSEADVLEDDKPVLKVIPWLYTWLTRMRLEGWVLRVCQEHHASGPGFDRLKAYCDSMSGYWRPPNLWDPAVLRTIVDEVEKARRNYKPPQGNKP